jgi:hypothetical protein
MNGTAYVFVFGCDIPQMSKEEIGGQLAGDMRKLLEAPLAYLEIHKPCNSRDKR